jgi:alkanesulfonate monooxygenase SsuD/methylene tetrahydromethanopterin reductase-like flavin-dependent oxidoreductase (luciferase family)
MCSRLRLHDRGVVATSCKGSHEAHVRGGLDEGRCHRPELQRPADPATIVAVAPAAERLGYDSVRTTDHIMMPRGYDGPYGHIYESL